jgi:hypothetical protein
LGAYLGASATFDQAIADFSLSYADQNETDHRSLLDAIASGDIPAETDT